MALLLGRPTLSPVTGRRTNEVDVQTAAEQESPEGIGLLGSGAATCAEKQRDFLGLSEGLARRSKRWQDLLAADSSDQVVPGGMSGEIVVGVREGVLRSCLEICPLALGSTTQHWPR